MIDEQLKHDVDTYVDEVWEDVVADMGRLVRHDSVEDLEHAEPGKPWGPAANDALVEAERMAERLGLQVTDLDGYLGFADVPGASGPERYVATIAHTDIVPTGEGWNFPPLAVTRKDGMLIGRGVADDKGPFVLSLYNVKNALFEGGATAWNKAVKVGQTKEFIYTGEAQPFTLSFGGDVYETGDYDGLAGTFGNAALAGAGGEMAPRVTTNVTVSGLSEGTYQASVTMSNIHFTRLDGAKSKDDLPGYAPQFKDEFPIWNFFQLIDRQSGLYGNEYYYWNVSNGSFSFYLNGGQFGLNQMPTLDPYTASATFSSSVSGSATGDENTAYTVGLGLSSTHFDSRCDFIPGSLSEYRNLYMLPKTESSSLL